MKKHILIVNELFQYFFPDGVMYKYWNIFDDKTDWDYRKLSYALNTEDDQEMLISMLRNGVYSMYEHHRKTCHFVDAEIEHAKDIIESKSPFPKCRVTIEHIELIEKINQQDEDIRNEESCEKFYKTFHSYNHPLIYIDDLEEILSEE